MSTAGALVSLQRLGALTARELESFSRLHPRSRLLYERAKGSLLGGVPMHWMNKWASAQPIADAAGAFPLFASEAAGARIVDADGIEYVDFCLGDTGAMSGHGSPHITDQLIEASRRGLTHMLPSVAAVEAGETLRERFGLARWQLTVSATDANRFAIRLARKVTGRDKILVFNYCYHGSVDEAFATLGPAGEVVSRRFNLGPPVAPRLTTRVAEFNDEETLERELAHGDVACVLTEPALTNVGIVLPEPGFHEHLRAITRRFGSLLILDETHTLSVDPGGMTRRFGLEPDVMTLGKTIAGGLPAGAYGFSEALATRIADDERLARDLVEGIGTGGTLAGNAFTAAAISSTLDSVLTLDAYERMLGLSERWSEGVQGVIDRFGLPWHVTKLGARAEYTFRASPPLNGSEAAAAGDEALERYLRLYMINRGILTTPFHNMALMCPQTASGDVDLHTEIFGAAVAELLT